MTPKHKVDEEYIQLATRVPPSLFRRLKMLCVTKEMTMQDFVADALRERLHQVRKT